MAQHVLNCTLGIVVMALATLMLGCAALPPPVQPDDPDYAPVIRSGLQPPRAITGAIYQPQTSNFFFADRKANRIGDILTVTLAESTTAIKESETEISKDSQTTLAEPTLFDKSNIGLQTALSSSSGFTGSGDSDLKNSLRGSISVTVTEVLPGGALRVRGEKWMRLNRGDEYIRLSGLVRPEDIGPDNTINSTKVADARIAYSQTGELADANRIGWLSKFFTGRLWPF